MSRKRRNAPVLNLSEHHTIIGYFLLAIPIIIAFFSVVLTTESIVINIVFILLKICFIIAIVYQLINDFRNSVKIKFDLAEMAWLCVAVLSTYSLTHYLAVNVVLSASIIGVFGAVLLKKYQTSIYCGAFAGMVSLTLFNFLEVSVLALVCAVLFTITKRAFSGYGGKLGFVAFMSSFIVHDIFNEAYLPGSVDLNIYILMGVSVLGGVITYLVNHKIDKTSNVLASALPTMLISLLVIYVYTDYIQYLPMFFAGTFVGMSSKYKLNNIIYFMLACVILAYIYTVFENMFIGLGGKLGFMAIFAVLIVNGIDRVYNLFKKKVIV